MKAPEHIESPIDGLITTREVQKILGVSRTTVMNWKDEGTIAPETKIGPGGGMLLWDPEPIHELARQRAL